MLDIILSEIAAVLLFFYSMHRFSKMIMRINIHKLKKFITKLTKSKIKSLSIGIIGSAFMQSNKAVSSIALTLVNAGVLSGILIAPILFGAAIGASSTAFLVSCKFKSLEEILIICGAILKKTKYKNVGRIIFYLGLLLFSLELMTHATSVLKDNPNFQKIFTMTQNPLTLFAIGTLSSLVLQSGALAISIITILVECGAISFYASTCFGIGIIIGSTLDLIIVVIAMNNDCKKVCFENIIFLTISAMIILFFAPYFTQIMTHFSNVGMGFAVSHLIARIVVSMFGMLMFYMFVKNKEIIIKHTHNRSKKIQENYNTNIKI